MLHTNLATRPFYNESAVRLGIGVAAVLAVAFTLFNVEELVRLSAAQSRLGTHAEEAEAEASRLRVEAAAVRTRIDPRELESVAAAAREANAIIDQRAFSWTDLFAQFEATLPPDVRIKAVQPRLNQGTFAVAVVAQARGVDDVDEFIEALEQTGTFRDVKPVEESVQADGLIEAIVEGVYAVPERQP
ncbi:MAG: hypothetical protein FJW23_01465 [Acidimicrobiia bacterium]|nr:hypothetical protein [Acidimicrobiia bacterium]